MQIFKRVFFFILVLTATNFATAQDAKFLIVDNDDNPIVGATFSYDTQRGISDDYGYISFDYVENSTMYFSYVGLGKWQMNSVELQIALEEGFTEVNSHANTLQPVTVISIRPKRSEKVNLNYDYNDKIAHDAGDLLTSIPAISGIRKGGSYGLDPVMRGFKYDQLNIVMNGVQSAIAACPNRMDPPTSQMAPNMVDRVEVFKGPYALRYGGGLGGTINFVSEIPSFYSNRTTYGRLSSKFDTNGEMFRSEAMIGVGGERTNVSLFGSWANGNDYKDGDGNIVAADFNRSSIGAKLALKVTDDQTIEINAFQNKAKDIDFPALMMDLRSDQTLMLNATHRVNFDRNSLTSWSTTLFLSDVDHLMDNRLKQIEPRMMDAQTNALTKNMGGRTEGVWQIGNGKLFVGADYKVEQAEGKRERIFLLGPMAGNTLVDNAWQNAQIQKAGLFAEYNYRKQGWQFIASGRIEQNQAEVIDADPIFEEVFPDHSTSQVNPSLSLGVLHELHEGISLGLWAARAVRSASITERYINRFAIGQDPYEMIGDPNLNQEINNQIDFTMEWKSTKQKLEINLFSAYLQDFISSVIDTSINTLLPNRPGVRRFTNIDNAVKYGFEVSHCYNFSSWIYSDISLAYIYAQDLDRSQPLPEIAPFDVRVGLAGRFDNNRFQPRMIARYVASQDRISTEYGETSTPDFFLLDAEIDYSLSNKINLSAGVSNLFDVTYYEHLNRSTANTDMLFLNDPGRNYSLAISFML